MRIGIDALLIGRPGGVGGYVRSLLAALARYEHVHRYVVYTTPHAGLPPDLPPERFAVRRVPGAGSRLRRVLWQQFGLPRRLAADRVDVLHAPSYVVPLRAHVPVVLTLHDAIALKHPRLCGRLNALHYRRHLPRAVRKAAIVIASSLTTRRDILETCGPPPEKVRVIYPGLDPAFRPASEADKRSLRERMGLPARFILFVGNVEPKKDLATLLHAYTRLPKSRPDAPGRGPDTVGLVIAGAAVRGAGRLRRLADRLGVADRVHLIGPVCADDLPCLYSAADVFAFPSLYEGFGLPVVEAMACGTPVVCSDGGALPEAAGGAALLFPAGDPAALAEALRRALDEPCLRARLVRDGLARAALLDWQAVVRRLAAAYEEAAGAGGACP